MTALPSKQLRQKNGDKKIVSIVGTKNYRNERRGHENDRALGLVGIGSRFGVRLPLAASPPRLFEKLRFTIA